MKSLLRSVAVSALIAGTFVQPSMAQTVNAPSTSHSSTSNPSTSEGATHATVTTQLPRNAVPVHYDVTFEPDAAKLTFTGKAAITLDVLETTHTITLQAADLAIAKAGLTTAAGKSLGAATVALGKDAQTAAFTFAKPLAVGRYVLAIDYSGKINTQAYGLFSLDYKAADGSDRRALYTQFENSDARRFMPSWDEPFYKASFRLKAVVPTGQMAIGNLPVESTAPAAGGKSLVTFGESPKMSTYLLFFGLGDFERDVRRVGDTEVSVVTKHGDLKQAGFALDTASQVLPWMNEYFATKYPLPRLDNIAAPGRSQFFSAMENWGAIFYFENAMLLDPKTASNSVRERIFTVVAHEMAHQWFGDLVTMSWWDDLWLNEGFASWMENRATEKFHPEWMPELTGVSVRESAMAQDAYATTHPIIHHVGTVEEASQAFDDITYNKGEAVLRMLEGYAGADAWRDGVRVYIARYAHGNTVTDDLWREIEKTSGKPISRTAHDFTLQPGIPLVKVTASCAGGNTTLSLEQGEFSRDQPGKTPLSWHVPVQAAGLGDAAKVDTILEGKGSLTVASCDPVVVNAGQTGYYRVLYDPAAFRGLVGALGRVAPVDQLGLIGDAAALGYAGQQPMGDVLDLVAALPQNAAPPVMASAARTLGTLYDYADGNPARRRALGAYTAGRLLPVLAGLGWTPKADEPAVAGNLRASLINVLGDMAEPSVVAEAQRRFAASKDDPSAIDSSVRVSVLNAVATSADAATWDRLHEQARAETSAQFKTTLYSLLGGARDPALAQRALDLALTDEPGVTTSPVIISAVAGEHPELAFDFVMAHYDAVMSRLDSSASTRFVARLAQGSSDAAMIGKLKSYAEKRLAPTARRPVDEAIAKIEDRIRVRETRMPQVDAWLAKHGG